MAVPNSVKKMSWFTSEKAPSATIYFDRAFQSAASLQHRLSSPSMRWLRSCPATWAGLQRALTPAPDRLPGHRPHHEPRTGLAEPRRAATGSPRLRPRAARVVTTSMMSSIIDERVVNPPRGHRTCTFTSNPRGQLTHARGRGDCSCQTTPFGLTAHKAAVWWHPSSRSQWLVM